MVPQIIIHPDLSQRLLLINEILNNLNLHQNHPNTLWLGEQEKLGISQVRKIIDHLSLKPYQAGGQTVVIVNADDLTEEAQNALLKSLEEPPLESVIILGASSDDNFLPTILSRCRIVNGSFTNQLPTLSKKDHEAILKLFDNSIAERFQYIEKMVEKELFLEKLTIFFQQTMKENYHPQIISYISDILLAQKWAKQNVNIRAILEYLMLKLPKI